MQRDIIASYELLARKEGEPPFSVRVFMCKPIQSESMAPAWCCEVTVDPLGRGHSRSLVKAPSKLSAWAQSTRFKCSQPSLSMAAHSNNEKASYSIPRSSALSYCLSQQGRARQVTPNPSIERTRSGGAGLAFISFWAKPAPPPRAAHVKR